MSVRSDPNLRDAVYALACGTGLALLLDRPWVAAATVVCALLPTWGASLVCAWRQSADLTVALDPLDPDPALLARAFGSAAERAAASGAAATLCIMPLFGRNGCAMPLELTLNAKREAVCTAGGRTARGLPAQAWLPRHPLPITVRENPVLIRFTADPDRRLSSRIARPLPDTPVLLAHAGICAILLPVSGPAALTAAAALILRLVRNNREAAI